MGVSVEWPASSAKAALVGRLFGKLAAWRLTLTPSRRAVTECRHRRAEASFHPVCLKLAPPDARIMKQKLLNLPGDSEGQAGAEALRVALNY
jgi:hypothetical protein